MAKRVLKCRGEVDSRFGNGNESEKSVSRFKR